MRGARVSVFYVSGAGDIQMNPNAALCSVMPHSAELSQRESLSGCCALLVIHPSWSTHANQPPRLIWGLTRPFARRASGAPPEATSWPTHANQPPWLIWGWTRSFPRRASGAPPEAALGVEEGGSGSNEAAEAGWRASGMRGGRVSVFDVSGARDTQMSPNAALCPQCHSAEFSQRESVPSAMSHSATVPNSHNGSPQYRTLTTGVCRQCRGRELGIATFQKHAVRTNLD